MREVHQWRDSHCVIFKPLHCFVNESKFGVIKYCAMQIATPKPHYADSTTLVITEKLKAKSGIAMH